MPGAAVNLPPDHTLKHAYLHIYTVFLLVYVITDKTYELFLATAHVDSPSYMRVSLLFIHIVRMFMCYSAPFSSRSMVFIPHSCIQHLRH